MRLRSWGVAGVVCLAGGFAGWAQVAPVPTQNGLPGQPVAIKHTWVIGGTGPWDYLAMDPNAEQLLIAHGPQVQVVDVSTGAVAGTVKGFSEAHAIALDSSGDVAYVTDGPAGVVRVVDRRSYQVTASIRTGPNPRALALEPASGLLFVICSSSGAQQEVPTPTAPRRPARPARPVVPASRTGGSPQISIVTVIDVQKRAPVADVWIKGRLGFAQPDGSGGVYITVEDQNQILRLDGPTVANAVQGLPQTARDGQAKTVAPTFAHTPTLDWTGAHDAVPLHLIRIGQDCREPRGIAVDGKDARLFVACQNQKMAVVNSQTGEGVASFVIGPGADSIAWDASRGLIYTANGGGYGSVTVIRRDVTDTYTVVQNLPTLHRARTLAVNASNGDLYVVTTLYGADIAHTPANGIGQLKVNPVEGSFQVLVIGS